MSHADTSSHSPDGSLDLNWSDHSDGAPGIGAAQERRLPYIDEHRRQASGYKSEFAFAAAFKTALSQVPS
jgi:hypothetical protein